MVLFVVFTLLSACTSHYNAGMSAYQSGNYSKAVDELSLVGSEHPNHTEAVITLSKAEFKLAATAFKESVSPSEAITNLKKMIPLAMQSQSKEVLNEAFQLILAELKDAENAAFIKEMLGGMITMLRESGDVQKIGVLGGELLKKIPGALFNAEVRDALSDGLRKLKDIGSQN